MMWEDRPEIPPGTAQIRTTNCPVCKATNSIEVRTWAGRWVSVAQGEAMTNNHYLVTATCGCRLSEHQEIESFYQTEGR